MSAADEFREHAATCLRAAQLTAVPDIKVTLIDMAQHWNQLAERMDQFAAAEAESAAYRLAPEADGPADRHAGRE